MCNAYVKQENGYPTLYVDGEQKTPLIYALSDVPLGEPDGKCAQKNIPLFLTKVLTNTFKWCIIQTLH